MVRSLHAERVEIAGSVLGVPLALDIDGKAALAPLGKSTVELTIKRRAARPAETTLQARYAGGGRTVRLALSARETGQGVLAVLLDTPAVPALKLALEVTNGKQLVGALAADIDGRPLGDTPLGRALGADAKLAAKITLQPSGDVAADGLKFDAAQLSLAGKAQLTDNAGQDRREARLQESGSCPRQRARRRAGGRLDLRHPQSRGPARPADGRSPLHRPRPAL